MGLPRDLATKLAAQTLLVCMYKSNAMMILSFRTDRSLQTVQAQIRLKHCWRHSMVEPLSLNFRVFTEKLSGILSI